MKRAAVREHGGCAKDENSESQSVPPFTLVNIERVDYKSKRALFTVMVPGVGKLDCDYFEPPGREPFINSRSVRSAFDGAWRRTVVFDELFLAAILAAVLEALEAGPD